MTCLAQSFAFADWLSQPWIRWPLTLLYVGVLSVICVYGLHRYFLVWLYYRHRRRRPRPAARFARLPRITVQLPMYNESQVAVRIIDAACALDYPPELLQIQVLDDSTDGSDQLASERVSYWRQQGVDIQFLHRTDRKGYKAGALAAAMPDATGQFIAIFDADFLPDPRFLKRTIHYFTDPKVGMVQARWGHLNRDDSLLTRSQAICLDAHFLIEHAARCQSDRWMNFNGTAGLWRREAIDSAGGWQTDTLTEDVDLSYRSQMAGWRFIFTPHVICPAELPPEMNAFKSQQHRWTKGSIQTAIKLLPRLLRSPAPWPVKLEAFFHLTNMVVYLCVTVMVLLFFPAFYVNLEPFKDGTMPALLWSMSLFALGTLSAGAFYVASQRIQRRSIWITLLHMPLLMAVGVGIALNNSRAVVEAMVGHESPFVRTPKYNSVSAPQLERRRIGSVIPTPSIKTWMMVLELGMGAYTTWCAWMALHGRHTSFSAPFLVMFATGYFYVGLTSLWSQRQARRPRPPVVAAGV